MSSGIVSPAGAYMARDLQMPGWHYGCLSPVYTIGKVIGAGLFATLFNVMNRKYLIVFAGFFHLFTNVMMTITRNSIFFLGLRTLAGIVHIWPCVYTPIWIGQFAPAGWQKFMKNAASVCSGLGRSTGFLIELYFGAPNWRIGWIINGLNMAGMSLLLCFIPSIYFSSKLTVVRDEKRLHDLVRPSKADIVSIYDIRRSRSDERDGNLFRKHKNVLTNGVFVGLVMARCVVQAIKGMIQFWTPKYVSSIANTDKTILTWTYWFMVSWNPLIGSMIGSHLTPLFGDYRSKRSIIYLTFLYSIGIIGFTPCGFLKKDYLYLIFASVFQICSHISLPTLQQIMMSSIDPEDRKKSSVVASFSQFFVGSTPSPPVYGLIMEYYGRYDPMVAMRWYAYYGYTGILWVIIAAIFKCKYDSEKKEGLIPEKEDKINHEFNAHSVDPQVTLRQDDDNIKNDDEGEEMSDKGENKV